MRITRRDQSSELGHIYGRMRDAHHLLSTSGDPSHPRKAEAVSRAVAAAEVAAGAALTGFAAGRLNHWNIPKTPLPLGLTVGVTLHAFDLLGWAPRWWPTKHVANLANGAIASWATLLGASQGQESLARAGEPPNLAAGPLPLPGPRPMHLPAPQARPSPLQPQASSPKTAPAAKVLRKPLTEAEIAAMSHRHT